MSEINETSTAPADNRSVLQRISDSGRVDFARFYNTKYFPALDGLRAFCVLVVIFNHLHSPHPSWILGYVGVDVFFVLSGFLITTLLIREKEDTHSVSFSGFYVRRFFRIIPIYYLVILIYFVATKAVHDPQKTQQYQEALPWLLGFSREVGPADRQNTVFGHAWTLGIEEKFYIFWPILLMLVMPFKRRGLAVLVVVLGLLLALPSELQRSYCGIFFGSLLAILLSKSCEWLPKAKIKSFNPWLALLLVVAAYIGLVLRVTPILLFSGMVTLFVGSLVLGTGGTSSFLAHPILVFAGKRSYAIYLVHVLVVNSVEAVLRKLHLLTYLLSVPLTFLVSLAFASLLYVLVERPCVAQGRKLSHRLKHGDAEQLERPI